jgi:CHAD domain-containing protein
MAKPTEVDGVKASTSVSKAAHRLTAARLGDVRRYERVLSNGVTEEAIHDMRVAAHRLRVALLVFGGRKASKLERKVKQLQDALGEIRDLQVQLGWLEKQKNLADAEGIRMLLAQLRATLLDRERDLRTALEEWIENSAPKLEKGLKKVSGKGKFGGKRMQRELKDWLQQVKRRLRTMEKSWSPQIIHKFRIQVKRLRYVAELLREGVGKPADAILETITPVQKQVGDLHDSDVRLELLSEFGRTAKAPWKRELQMVARRVSNDRRKQLRQLRGLVRRWDKGSVLRHLAKRI